MGETYQESIICVANWTLEDLEEQQLHRSVKSLLQPAFNLLREAIKIEFKKASGGRWIAVLGSTP